MGFKARRQNCNNPKLLSSQHRLRNPAWCHLKQNGAGRGAKAPSLRNTFSLEFQTSNNGKSITTLNQFYQPLIVLTVKNAYCLYPDFSQIQFRVSAVFITLPERIKVVFYQKTSSPARSSQLVLTLLVSSVQLRKFPR